MTSNQPTLTPAPPSPIHTLKARAAHTDWDKTLTDGLIYLIAFGGFYVGYQVLFDMATKVGMPADQAAVVSGIADLLILTMSRKAVQEIKEGRSAWGIRTIVVIASLATFSLQLRAAWPHPTSLGFHGLAPAAWIIGHETMLRGRLRTAKATRKAAQIAAGLRPAPLPSIRRIWWLLAPFSTFTIWRLTKLTEQPPADVIRLEAARRKAKNKDIPRAWESYLTTDAPATQAPTPFQHTTCGSTFFSADALMAKLPPATVLYRRSDETQQVPTSEVQSFLRILPEPPLKGRPKDKAMAFIREIDALSVQYDITVTDKYIAQLLEVTPSRISRLRDAIRDEDAAAQPTRP